LLIFFEKYRIEYRIEYTVLFLKSIDTEYRSTFYTECPPLGSNDIDYSFKLSRNISFLLISVKLF